MRTQLLSDQPKTSCSFYRHYLIHHLISLFCGVAITTGQKLSRCDRAIFSLPDSELRAVETKGITQVVGAGKTCGVCQPFAMSKSCHVLHPFAFELDHPAAKSDFGSHSMVSRTLQLHNEPGRLSNRGAVVSRCFSVAVLMDKPKKTVGYFAASIYGGSCGRHCAS